MLMPQRKRLGFAVGAVEVNRSAKAQFPRFFFHAPNAPGLLRGPGFGFLRSLCSKNSFSVVTASVSLAEFFSSTTVRQRRFNPSCSSGVMAHSWESEIQNLPRNVPTSSGMQRTGSGEHCRGCKRAGIPTPQIAVLQGSSAQTVSTL
jgi:hypothetical protein